MALPAGHSMLGEPAETHRFQSMEHHFLRDLIVLYGMAMVIAFLMRKARQPTIIGYLITGVVAGPFGMQLIAETSGVEILAEVGVALLLFTIGLELSLEKLAKMKEMVLGVGSLQVFGTIGVSVGILLLYGFATREGIYWGFLAAASSTAIVMKLLHDRAELETMHGRIIVGVLLFQDLCVVPMMALLPALAAPGAAQTIKILLALLKSLAVVGGILLGARYLFPPLLRAIVGTRSRELFVIGAIFFAMGTAFGASLLGLSLALGAFLAGIVLSESEYGHQIMAEIMPFRDLFNSLFFISIGMLIDLRFVASHALPLAGITVGLIAGKAVTAGLAVRLLGFPPRLAALVGLGLAQVGEFSFVMLREGEKLKLISESRYQLFLAGAVLTMMFTPPLIMLAPRVSQWFGQKARRKLDEIPGDGGHALGDHVIICGYGLNGKRLARLLRENSLPYVVVEMNSALVRAGRAEGERIYFGDVSSIEILEHAGAKRARAIVFAISDPAILPRAISHARLLNPDMHIVARVKRYEDVRNLRKAGASEVVAEELEAWMEIVVRILRLYGMPREVVAQQVAQLRASDYEMIRILPIPGQPLRHLAHLLPQIEVELFHVLPGSPLVGMELRHFNLRERTGASVLAIVRELDVIHNPSPALRFEEADQLILIGSGEQLTLAMRLLQEPEQARATGAES